MLNMTRTIVLAAVLAAVAATPAGAATKKTYKYTSTVLSGPVSTANGYPGLGGTATLAGSLKSKPFGDGAVVDRVTITGQPQPNVIAFKGTEVDYYSDGSLRNTLTGTATISADGTQNIVVNGRITGGTARYKGATGSYRFTGTTPPGSTVLSGGSTGTIVI